MSGHGKDAAGAGEASQPDVRKAAFRNAMARLGAAVHIITTDGPEGKAGLTATAVCSLTDSPPALLVCINRSSSSRPFIIGNGVLCVNTLASGHEPLSRRFGAGGPMEDRFGGDTWETMSTGSPVLRDALISFDCRVVRIADGGSHDIVICEVEGIRLNEAGRPLVYFDRSYHSF